MASGNRQVGNLGNIKYNSNLGMLEFTDMVQFKATMNKIENDAKNFQFDKGNTQTLLNALNSCNVANFNDNDVEENDDDDSDMPQNVIKLLRRNAPLSDTVLLTFLRKNFPPNKIKRVLLKSIDFSGRVADYYLQMNLPQNVKNTINQRHTDHVSYIPGFDDFEKLFPNYTSFNKYINEQERLFLLSGNDPDSPQNPKHAPKTLIGSEAVLFNQYKEVKIGDGILKLLPNRNVLIKNGSISILNSIRLTGQVPEYTPPTIGPENGLPITQAPAIIDTNILVQPTDSYNNPCGGDVGTSPSMGERTTFTTNIGGTGTKYYWNFGDGYVSYQKNPTHRYMGNAEHFTVTLTTYDSGIPCGGGYVPGGNSTGNNNTGGGGGQPCGSMIVFGSPITGQNSNFNINTNFTGYTPGGTIYYTVSFGDGSPAFNGTSTSQIIPTVTHPYPAGIYTTYNYVVTVNYAGCIITYNGQILFTQPSGGGSSSCCDSRDREKETWKDADKSHKFNHKLVLHNLIGAGGRFTADINTYYKFIGIWTPDWAQGCVDVAGYYYTTCSNDSPCNSTAIQFNSGSQCGGSPNHGANYPSGTFGYGPCKYWIGNSINSSGNVASGGSAYGNTSTIYIGTCND